MTETMPYVNRRDFAKTALGRILAEKKIRPSAFAGMCEMSYITLARKATGMIGWRIGERRVISDMLAMTAAQQAEVFGRVVKEKSA